MPQRFAILIVAALAACSSGPVATFSSATAQPACAPNDGPAVQVNLVEDRDPPTTITVLVYRAAQQVDGKSWSVAPPHDVGLARVCDPAQHCEDATDGEIRFAAGSSALRGVVDLRFPTRGRVRGSFDAGWLEIAAICG